MLTQTDIDIIKSYENLEFRIIKILEDSKNKEMVKGKLSVISWTNPEEIAIRVQKASGFGMTTSCVQELVDFTETSLMIKTKNSTYLLLKEGGEA